MTTQPRAVALDVRRARRALGQRSPSGEFKAALTASRITERFLKVLAEEEVSLYIVVADKLSYKKLRGEELYREVVAKVVRHCVERAPHLQVILDRRYSNIKQRTELEQHIRETVADIRDQVVLITQADSTQQVELQAVDFVAWAFWQKYERGNDRFSKLLAAKVVVEESLQ